MTARSRFVDAEPAPLPVSNNIVVRTLSDQVFEIVRERIVTGSLPDDAAIRQDALATELGVSKIPVREALGRLEQEGFLTSQANRGYSVRPMSAEQADEIYALRLLIEPAAAGRGALDATERDRAEAVAAFQALDEAANTNLAEVAVRNRHFHVALVRPGGRLLTTQLVERLSILAERYVISHLEPAGRDARAHLEHRHLIDAWMARDQAVLEKLLHQHIEATLWDLRAQFAAAGN
ncbi:GntR family transcriptional regulator [Sphingomonas rubra]|uniref:DNA-binding transcriptional regulator, GntR family n=1 Tax=Sphingomonas rubra TaxID=634430 RepID=A0A1I5RGB5_9SPHN|nr:GntR family transcriptional regulator [Sphingomonas rubra]SFP57614.1 DNA-binding transcriptional regulator, GntR family [Sphingomonas rubra]